VRPASSRSVTATTSGRAGTERIAVLGAGGFIGSHLVPALLARRDCVVDAVDLTFDKLPPTPPGRVNRIQASIDRPGLLDEITARCDVVVSLTALCNPALYNTEPLAVIDASFTDLVPLVKLCTARRRWLVHMSTCEVYGRRALDGDGRATTLMREDETGLFLGPVHRERWSYACAKQLLERVIWAHGHHHGLRFTVIRPFNVIGPRMDFVRDVDGQGIPRVLASFLGALLKGEDLLLVDGGHQRRSFICVDDFVEAVLRILERPRGSEGEILNLGNPANDASIRELAEALVAAWARVDGRPPVSMLRKVRAEDLYGAGYDDTVARLPDIAKAQRLLNWTPTTTLAGMLPRIVDDYRARYLARIPARAAAGAND
jgi:UDP-apiose/xylose synthase